MSPYNNSTREQARALHSETEQHPPALKNPCQELTDELIDSIDDPLKLRNLVKRFWRKTHFVETELQIIKTVQKSKLENADRQIQELRSELRKSQAKNHECQSELVLWKEALSKQISDALEEDFNCSICDQLFVEPTVLKCTHTFCTHCIGRWKDLGNNDCPLCRKPNLRARELTTHTGIDNFLKNIHKVLSPEMQEDRKRLVLERNNSGEIAALPNNPNNSNSNDASLLNPHPQPGLAPGPVPGPSRGSPRRVLSMDERTRRLLQFMTLTEIENMENGVFYFPDPLQRAVWEASAPSHVNRENNQEGAHTNSRQRAELVLERHRVSGSLSIASMEVQVGHQSCDPTRRRSSLRRAADRNAARQARLDRTQGSSDNLARVLQADSNSE